MGNRINPYNVEAQCLGPSVPNPGYCFTTELLETGRVRSQTIVPCMNYTNLVNYMNRADVQKALFIEPGANTNWDVCAQNLTYNVEYSTMLPIYNDLIANGYRVILYSGDLDSCVNYIGTQTFASTITASGKAIDWHPWFAQTGIVAGYSFSVGNLTFATVLNAGHMVPQYQKIPALYLFSNFLSGQPL